MSCYTPRHGPLSLLCDYTQQLPTEVLSIIFQSALDLLENPAKHEPALLDISRVCKRWCNVARATPSLWATIFIGLDKVDGLRVHAMGAPRLYLQRSKCVPLHFCVDVRDPEWPIAEPEAGLDSVDDPDYVHPTQPHLIDKALDIVFAHLARCRSFTFFADTWMHTSRCLDRLNELTGVLPLLESIRIGRINEYIPHAENFIPELPDDWGFRLFSFVRFPQLKHVELSGVHIDDWSALPCEQLETLVLAYHHVVTRPDREELLDMLSRCQVLTSLTLRHSGAYDDNIAESPGPPPALPRLRTLELGYPSVAALACLLALLGAAALTALEALSLEDYNHDANPAPEDVSALVGALVLPRLATLRLERVEANAEACGALLAGAPRLRTLTLAGTPSEAILVPGPPQRTRECTMEGAACALLDLVRGGACEELKEVRLYRAQLAEAIFMVEEDGMPPLTRRGVDIIVECGPDDEDEEEEEQRARQRAQAMWEEEEEQRARQRAQAMQEEDVVFEWATGNFDLEPLGLVLHSMPTMPFVPPVGDHHEDEGDAQQGNDSKDAGEEEHDEEDQQILEEDDISEDEDNSGGFFPMPQPAPAPAHSRSVSLASSSSSTPSLSFTGTPSSSTSSLPSPVSRETPPFSMEHISNDIGCTEDEDSAGWSSDFDE